MKNLCSAVAVALLVLLVGVGSGFAAGPANPDVPENLKVPAGEKLVLMAHAKGVQIYVCQNADQKPAWTLKAPEAELADEGGKTIIHHSAGPSWKHTDGSEVTGKMVAKHDAPNGNAIRGFCCRLQLKTEMAFSRKSVRFREFTPKGDSRRHQTRATLPPMGRSREAFTQRIITFMRPPINASEMSFLLQKFRPLLDLHRNSESL